MSEEKKTRGSGPESTNEQERHPRRRAETLVRHAAADSARDQAACVSAVIGEGAEAHRIVRVGDWTLTVPGEAGTEPEIPDTALAEKLGMTLHHLRELSARHEKAENIAPRVYRIVRETGGRPGNQRFYNEADALFLVTRSETPKAIALTKEMIAVYMLARRGLLVPIAPHDRVAALEAVAVKQSAQIATLERELASGVIGFEAAEEHISRPLRRIARLRSHDTKSYRSELRRYANLLAHYLGHVGRGSKWAMLQRALLGVAQRHISTWMDEAIAFDRKHPTRGQPLLDLAPQRPN